MVLLSVIVISFINLFISSLNSILLNVSTHSLAIISPIPLIWLNFSYSKFNIVSKSLLKFLHISFALDSPISGIPNAYIKYARCTFLDFSIDSIKLLYDFSPNPSKFIIFSL